MKKILVEFKVLDTSGSINKTSEQMGNLGRQTQKTTKKFKDNTANAGLNNAILMETSRLASDASFGFMAIGNNLSQLINLFQMSAKAAGGVTSAFRKLLTRSSLLIIGIQLVISFLPKLIKRFQESRKDADALGSALGTARAESTDYEAQVKSLQSAIDSGNLTFKESEIALNKLKKLTGENSLELDANNKLTQASTEILQKNIEKKIQQAKADGILQLIQEESKKAFEEIAKLRAKENSSIFKFFTLLKKRAQPIIDVFVNIKNKFVDFVTSIVENPIFQKLLPMSLRVAAQGLRDFNEEMDSSEEKSRRKNIIDEKVNKIQEELAKKTSVYQKSLDELNKSIIGNTTVETKGVEKKHEFLEITEKQISAIEKERLALEELARFKEKIDRDTERFEDRRALFAIQSVMIEEKAGLERLALIESQGVNEKAIAIAKSKFNILIDKKTNEARKEMLFDLGDAIVQAAGEGSAIGKAAAVAMAIMNVHEGITKALTLNPPFSFIAAATVALKGFSAVRSIMSTKIPGGGGGGGASAPSGIGGAGDVAAPDFNVVGDTGTSTLARVLGEGRRTPTRAYVSMNDVIENNEIMRNIEDTVSL